MQFTATQIAPNVKKMEPIWLIDWRNNKPIRVKELENPGKGIFPLDTRIKEIQKEISKIRRRLNYKKKQLSEQ
jgi:hypothetical protein